jgi:hypothetical protein
MTSTSEKNTVAESTPRLLTNTDVYTVRVGQHFVRRSKEGDLRPVNFPCHYTLEGAKAVARQLQQMGKAKSEIRIVPRQKKEGEFWIDVDGSGNFSDYSLKYLPKFCPLFNDVPRWFIDAMRKVNPSSDWWKLTEETRGTNSDWGGDSEAAVMIFQEQFHTQGWRDHEGWIEKGEQSIFVSEPYAVKGEDLVELLEFVNRFNFELRIWGSSNHYPSAAMMIEIWPKGAPNA